MKNITKEFNLTDELYNEIMNEDHSISYWESELANTTGRHFNKTYGSWLYMMTIVGAPCIGRIGTNWEEFKPKIHALLCNGNKPNQWVEKFIAGDARLLITELIIIFISELNVGVRIAIPLVAITLKTGICTFCSVNEKKNCTED